MGRKGILKGRGRASGLGQACTPAPVGCPALALTLGPSFPEPSKSQPCSPCLHAWPHPPTPAPTCQPRASGLSLGRPQLLRAGRELSAAPRPQPRIPGAASCMAQGTPRTTHFLPLPVAPAGHVALQEASPGAWAATCHNLRNMETDTKVKLVVSGPYLAASQQWPIQRPLDLISALSARPALPAIGFKAVPTSQDPQPQEEVGPSVAPAPAASSP